MYGGNEMDWLKELLKNAGIAEDQIETIVANAAKEAPKHVVPKTKYNDLSTEKKLSKHNFQNVILSWKN